MSIFFSFLMVTGAFAADCPDLLALGNGISFQIGGVNSTATVSAVRELNGIRIEELERRMRPQMDSFEGFLGPEESLVDVLATDNHTVVDLLKLTHQELATHLRYFCELYLQSWKDGIRLPSQIRYQGGWYRFEVFRTKGFQDSPFQDGTRASEDFELTNLIQNRKISGSFLHIPMIEKYGFYEGKGTKYRLDPVKIAQFFDFLTPDRNGMREALIKWIEEQERKSSGSKPR